MAQVSVIIPVYNIERHLRQCLDSVAGQTLTDLEIVCVDDGSTDKSPEILAEYAGKDGRFQIITQSNAGPGVARNAGMARATGEYLIFLDSDDWFEPDFLERMVDKAAETGADVTICRAVEFDTHSGKELPSEWMLKSQYLPGEAFSPEEIAAHIFQFTYGMPWDKLYRRKYLLQLGIDFPPLKNSEDLAFVFPSLLSAKRIAVVDQVLIHHRINRSSSVSNSRASRPEAPYEAFQIVKTYLKNEGLVEQYQQSFLNWAMEFLVWHVSNMENKDIQKEYFRILRQDWLPAMEFDAHPRSYYENSFTYCKYLLARYAPWPVFYGVLRVYKHWKGRAGRGNGR